MSEQTKADLARAIEAHIGDETGHVTGAWLLLIETTTVEDLDSEASRMFAVSHGSGFVHLGLAEWWRDAKRGEFEP